LRVVTVIGNRPQFIKAAAVSRSLRAAHEELLVHTGQHHDDELSTIFVQELAVPRPEVELGIHGGTNTEQTARMLAALGPLLADRASPPRRESPSPTSRPACAPSTARCPRSSTAC
jgi:UDP-N-acetylglucosamine 2-epimerase (non-hydrolysing)/UDP-GlcNAc3NAcA epimerase